MTDANEDRVEVMDLYLASYYVLRGCKVVEVTCLPTGKSVSCSIVISGAQERLHAVQDEYFGKRASVNLWDFRSAYNHVNSCVHQAKRRDASSSGVAR